MVGIDLRQQVPPIAGVEIELGPHRRQRFDEAEVIVVSPGIPPSLEPLRAAVARGVMVTSELSFAAGYLTAPLIGITGTNGKSTVTWFTQQLLEAADVACFAGGNLGNPLSSAVLSDRLPEVVVAEISSYQLELPAPGGGPLVKPAVAAILNLTPDHLDRHGTMERYAAAKARLFERMDPTDWAAIPLGDERLVRATEGHGGRRAWLGGCPGVRREGRQVTVDLGNREIALSLDGMSVPGAHNLDNAATAAWLVLAGGFLEPSQVRLALPRLRALPHRMEQVHSSRGVRWINDSKATNLEAARAGICGIDQPGVVLLGGRGKQQPDGTLGFAALAEALARHRAVVCFGEDGPRISRELASVSLPSMVTPDLARAVELAAGEAEPGEVVLLSPGCASFDEFADFEHRGRSFAELARALGPIPEEGP